MKVRSIGGAAAAVEPTEDTGAITGVTGFFSMPDTSGESLEQIETERAQG